MRSYSKKPGLVLFLSCYDPSGISTVVEQVQEWERLSLFEVREVNLFSGLSERGMRLPDPSALDGVDIVFMHSTTAYFPANLRMLCEDIRRHSTGRMPLLVLYKQDEHVRSHETARIIGEFGIDLVLTCVSAEERDKVYPSTLVGSARFEQVYTGFVSERLVASIPQIDWSQRRRDFLYRGSKQPPSIGRLGYEKYVLARRLSAACQALQVSCDASAEWEDRILGFDWIGCLADSRATVSLESGSNCFDFDGELEERVARYLKERSELDPWSEAGNAKLHNEVLADYEGNVQYGQIAPRHIEAVLTRTVQLLLPGTYSDLFVKERHYLELDPSLSNLGELWERLQDPALREPMLDCAYEEIGRNPRLQYRWLVERVDTILDDLLQRPHSAQRSGSERTWAGEKVSKWIHKNKRPLVLVLCPHLAHLDPRIGWWKHHSFPDARVELIEADVNLDVAGGDLGSGEVLLTARAKNLTIEDLPADIYDDAYGCAALSILTQVAQTSEALLRGGTEYWDHSSGHAFLVGHMVRHVTGLLEAATRVRGADGIVVTDLPALPAGLILRELFSVPLLYDAQEISSHAQGGLHPDEIEWWVALERRLLRSVDVGVTVSPGLAQWYERETGAVMRSVPNLVPLEHCLVREPEPISGPVRFVFLGIFAPSRGLEPLIEAWDLDPSMATLHLQGPDSIHKETCIELARQSGQLGHGIHFPDAVTEDALIGTASQYHIGVIPYLYDYPYTHCSPNKMGQYMAAGCAILSHQLSFVDECVSNAGCGMTVNFRSLDRLRAALHDIVENRERLVRWRVNAGRAARESLHWERQVASTASEFMQMIDVAYQAPSAAVLEWPTSARRRWLSAVTPEQPPEPPEPPVGYLALADWIARRLPHDSKAFRGAQRAHQALRRIAGL